MRKVAPSFDLDRIGDRYNDPDTQWKYEVWLDAVKLTKARADIALAEMTKRCDGWRQLTYKHEQTICDLKYEIVNLKHELGMSG